VRARPVTLMTVSAGLWPGITILTARPPGLSRLSPRRRLTPAGIGSAPEGVKVTMTIDRDRRWGHSDGEAPRASRQTSRRERSAVRAASRYLVLAVVILAAGVADPAAASASPFPTITSVNPNSSPPSGGGMVVISGTGFAPEDQVLFAAGSPGNGANSTIVAATYVSASQLTVKVPPDPDLANHLAADVFTVHVKPPNSSQLATCAIAVGYCNGSSNWAAFRILFTYKGTWGKAPTTTGVSPPNAAPPGGTKLTLTGANFTPDSQVVFGLRSGSTNVAATSVAQDGSSLTVFTPPESLDQHFPERVPVTVKTYAGTSNAQNVTYAWAAGPGPHITRITPSDGDPRGGQQVVIAGINLGGPNNAATVTMTYAVPANPQQCGACGPRRSSFGAVKITKQGTQLAAITPDVHNSAAVPQDTTITVASDAGADSVKFHLDDCSGAPDPSDLNPVHGLLNSIFSIPGCEALTGGFVQWMLQEPDVAGDLAAGSSEQKNPTEVRQLEGATAGIALGLLALLFSVSVLRFTIGAVATSSPGTVVKPIVHAVAATLFVVAWPTIYRTGVVTSDAVTNGIANGPINLDGVPNLLLAAMFTLGAGVAAFFGGVGLIIGILFVVAGVALFFALVALKILLFALMTLVFVGMPLLAVAGILVPELDWLWKAGIRAWGVGLIWPICWAVTLACAGAVFVDGFDLSPAGGLVKVVGNSLVSIMLLVVCVRMPGQLMRVALHGTGVGAGTRGIGGALILSHFVSRAASAAGAAVGLPPWLTGITSKRAAEVGIGGKSVVPSMAAEDGNLRPGPGKHGSGPSPGPGPGKHGPGQSPGPEKRASSHVVPKPSGPPGAQPLAKAGAQAWEAMYKNRHSLDGGRPRTALEVESAAKALNLDGTRQAAVWDHRHDPQFRSPAGNPTVAWYAAQQIDELMAAGGHPDVVLWQELGSAGLEDFDDGMRAAYGRDLITPGAPITPPPAPPRPTPSLTP
jgi:IPT/TIG domain